MMAAKKKSAGKKPVPNRTSANSGAKSSRQAKIEAATPKSGPNRILIATLVALVAIAAIVGGVIWADQSSKPDTSLPQSVPQGSSMGQGYRPYADVTLVDKAPVVDLYVDPQCPTCAWFEGQVGSTFAELASSGKIDLVYHVKDFLDQNLNNDSSVRAGNGAFCAAQKGAFVPYLTAVFEGQPAKEGDGFTDAQLKTFAEDAGLSGADLTAWETCSAAKTYNAYVDSVEETTFKAGVTGTPTIQINGKDVDFRLIATPQTLTDAVTQATKG